MKGLIENNDKKGGRAPPRTASAPGADTPLQAMIGSPAFHHQNAPLVLESHLECGLCPGPADPGTPLQDAHRH